MKQTILRSRDITCPSCIAKIEKGLESLEGVTSAKVHFSSGTIVIDHDPKRSSAPELARRVRRLGYAAEVVER